MIILLGALLIVAGFVMAIPDNRPCAFAGLVSVAGYLLATAGLVLIVRAV